MYLPFSLKVEGLKAQNEIDFTWVKFRQSPFGDLQKLHTVNSLVRVLSYPFLIDVDIILRFGFACHPFLPPPHLLFVV
jgi:hypothetical protein